jgi:hypothetical protein
MKGKKLFMREICKILPYRLELHVGAQKTEQAKPILTPSLMGEGAGGEV